jgi:hypothetical protein
MMSAMSLLPTWLLAALLPQAFGGTNKAIGGRRQATIVAIFGLLPLKGFDAFLETGDLPFEVFDVFSQTADGLDGFFESIASCPLLLLELLHLAMFLVGYFTPGCSLRPELFQFFFLRHAATLTVLSLILQLHSPSE